MSKSKRIRAARQRAASRPARQGGAGTAYRFAAAPWTAWLDACANPAASADTLTVLEHAPFGLVNPAGEEFPATLAGMFSDFDGTMQEFCEAWRDLASLGGLAWDRASNTVTMTRRG